MSNFEREQYEISIWEDYSLQTGDVVEIEERKVAVISSNEMDAISRAFNPRFSSNMNQVKSLSFDIYQKYRDENGELVANPFATMIQNETKIKLKFRGEWHDFIVKNIVEDSYNHTLKVQCKDLHTHVLSRIGYDVEFDIELENNIGTLQELANTAFSNTEWEILSGGEVFRERKEEPVYEVLVSRAFSGYLVTDTGKASRTIPVGSKILIFHSDVINFEEGVTQLQFVYSSAYSVDRDLLVLNEDSNYVVEGITVTTQTIGGQPTWVVKIGSYTIFTLEKRQSLSDDYRANKYIQSQHIEYDAKLGKYVKVYTRNGNKRYGYTETTYQSPLTVRDLITNGKNFLNTVGWGPENKLVFKTYQSAGIETLKSYLAVKMAANEVIQNSGIRDRANYLLDGLVKGEKLIVRAKVRTGTDTAPGADLVDGYLTMSIDGATYVSSQTSSGYHVWSITVPKTYSYSELVNNQAILRIKNTRSGVTTYWIEEVQLFKEVLDSNNTRITPGAIDIEPVVQVENFFYDPTQSYSTKEDITYESKNPSLYTPKFDGSYEKRRSVSISKSNLFNIAQELAEKFECWAVLKVTHDVNGKITNRAVQFTQKTGTRRPAGFVYGLDLQGIERTVDSDQISTKVIVEPNQNELSEHGYCSIAEAPENYSGENFIYNFNYYVQKGLIPFGQLQNDLYSSDANLGIGLITRLHIYNKERDLLITKQGLIRKNLTELKADKSFYENSLIAAKNQSSELFNKLVGLSGKTTLAGIRSWIGSASVEAKNIYTQYLEVGKVISASEALVQNRASSLTQEENRLKTAIAELKTNFDAKKDLVNLFNSKYYRFIQEGVWTSPDYYDNNMYYFDALSVSNSSAFPKIQYSIKVTSLAGLEEFKGKFFNVGDITTIEDTEYFGYIWVGGVRTPYKEEILVTEMTYNLDQPELDEITVQNYRPNFEELFQRITATTQSLQLAQGGYERAAQAITPQGTIALSVLQHSLTINQELVYSSNNSSYVQNHTGITMTDLNNTKHSTRYTPKGLFFTQDGGITWNVGVTAQGVSTAALTAGIIYTDNIVISQGGAPTFRWDNVGLTAYKFDVTGLDPGTFVRHDQYGFYGVTGAIDENDEPGFTPNDEQDVWDNAKFALTWKGFNLKSSNNGGYVRITSDAAGGPEITVNDGEHNRVELGRLAEDHYGLRIKNGDGGTVIDASSDGSVWIRDYLNIQTGLGRSAAIGKLGTEYSPIVVGSSPDRQVGQPILPGSVYNLDETSGSYNLTQDTHYLADVAYFSKHQVVINANGNFKVYDDGSVFANDGYFRGIIQAYGGFFEGEVQATSGTIGGARITSEGLVIEDGIFQIIGKDSNDEPIPVLDFQDGQLSIIASIEVDGTIRATGGTIGGLNITSEEIYAIKDDIRTFSINYEGDLVARSGVIGGGGPDGIPGIRIDDSGLVSENFDAINSTGFKIGTDGSIIANQLVIGDSATIADKLSLGNGSIYNPSNNDNLFIEAGTGNDRISLYDNGEMLLGNPDGSYITISGANSTIRGNNWSLTPQEAFFSNVNVSGTISTSVFEIGSVQSVGGQMIFKTATKALNNRLIPDSTDFAIDISVADAGYFAAGDWVILQGKDKRIERQIKELEDSSIILPDAPDSTDLADIETVINLGKVPEGSDVGEDWIIGVNGNKSADAGFLAANAITFSQFEVDEFSQITYRPKVVIGELRSILAEGIDTYGLYAEAAYLTGTLTTKTDGDQDTYAGVNTISGLDFNKSRSEVEDTSKIVFWAGASSINNIQNAPFQVTEKGTLYATNGIFTNSILVDAEISAAILKTAKIIGSENSPALKIYNTNNSSGGIDFINGTGEADLEDDLTMRLSTSGINLIEGSFMIDGSTVIGNDKSVSASSLEVKTEDNLASLKIQKDLGLSEVSLNFNNKTKISFAEDAIKASINTIELLSIYQNEISVHRNFRIGTVRFETTDGGCDIYVS